MFEKAREKTSMKCDRCRLEPLRDSHLKIIQEWFGDLELVSQAFGVLTDDYYLERIAGDYTRDILSNFSEVLGIWDRDSKLVGFINYNLYPGHAKTARIGIVIGRESDRSSGLGRSALMLALNHLFLEKDCRRVILETATFNERAQRCFLSCGFRIVRETTEVNFINGELFHKVDMELLREDFLENTGLPRK